MLKEPYYNENELVSRAQDGDEFALEKLISSYMGFIHYISKNYFLKDGDQQDLIQEATIGLLEAIKAYDSATEVKFRNFAFLCIKRELDSAVSRSNRKKRQVLNNAISIYSTTDDELSPSGRPYRIGENFIKTEKDTPENSLIEKEGLKELTVFLQSELTNLEQKVLFLRLQGFSYREITYMLEIQSKAVDNAIQRIRKKVMNSYKRTIIA
jgi:RNA polymerase sporulation-specific sigma factor